MHSSPTTPANDGWACVVTRINNLDPAAIEDLYAIFHTKFRLMIIRQLGLDGAEDSVQSCFATVIEAIQHGKLIDPARLHAYAATIVRRHIIQQIHTRCDLRKTQVDMASVEYTIMSSDLNPEQTAMRKEAEKVAANLLRTLPPRDLEILRRFYLLEQTEAQIRAEMGLSANEFRNIKHRAKNRFSVRWAGQALAPAHRQPSCNSRSSVELKVA